MNFDIPLVVEVMLGLARLQSPLAKSEKLSSPHNTQFQRFNLHLNKNSLNNDFCEVHIYFVFFC